MMEIVANGNRGNRGNQGLGLPGDPPCRVALATGSAL